MYELSVFDQILKQIPRRQFQSLLEKHGADKWVKSFTSWLQLVAMIYAQISAQTSLRIVPLHAPKPTIGKRVCDTL